MKLKSILIGMLMTLGLSASAQTLVPNVMPGNWAEMQRQAAIEHAYFANGGWRERERANNDAAVGIAILGIGLGVWAAHQAEERRQLAIREYEMEMEARRRMIESSPMATVERTHVPQCIFRTVSDQYGRLYRERVCL